MRINMATSHRNVRTTRQTPSVSSQQSATLTQQSIANELTVSEQCNASTQQRARNEANLSQADLQRYIFLK